MEEATTLVQGGYALGDNLFTWTRNVSMLDDGAFREAWRRYSMCYAAYHAIQLDGDFVECGVLFGSGVKTVIDYFDVADFRKTFWTYDTFDYNPVPGHIFERETEGLFLKVQERFQGYTQVNLVRELLLYSLFNNSPDSIAYLHLDLNQAEAEIAVLQQLFDHIVPGGILATGDHE